MPGEPPRVQPSKKVAAHWDADGNRIEGTLTWRSPRHHEPDLWSAYLSFYRHEIIDGVLGSDAEQQRMTQVPSGWTPIELLSHVLHMEQRWFVWGFLGEDGRRRVGRLDDRRPLGAAGPTPGGRSPTDVTAESLADRLRDLGERHRILPTTRSMRSPPAPIGFDDGDPPTLEWICFHVLAGVRPARRPPRHRGRAGRLRRSSSSSAALAIRDRRRTAARTRTPPR